MTLTFLYFPVCVPPSLDASNKPINSPASQAGRQAGRQTIVTKFSYQIPIYLSIRLVNELELAGFNRCTRTSERRDTGKRHHCAAQRGTNPFTLRQLIYMGMREQLPHASRPGLQGFPWKRVEEAGRPPDRD
ncbi:MAG: hypothetical protein DSY90_05055 [Deltaproteobacteria bacterium]|nr:MAG: hypothetical protein DSY90_05055 [Deltaproteobacteria bacterium]